jgi:hypothetical protein
VGLISGRVYIIIALVMFAVLFSMQFFGAGDGVVSFLTQVKGTAANAGLGPIMANFIIGPVIWSFDTYIYGPLIAALAWPIAIVWLFLFTIVWMFSLIAPGFSDIPGA